MKYLIHITIALTIVLSNSSYAISENELKDKMEFINLALKCSDYNYYAKDLEENERLGILGLSELFSISSEIISKYVTDNDRKNIPSAFINQMNDDFIKGFLVAHVSDFTQSEVEQEIFGRRFDFRKNENDYQDSQKKEFQDKAKELAKQNNCRFLK